MKTFAMIVLVLMLTACGSAVKKPEFPKAPEHLMRPAPELKQLPQPLH